MRVGRSEYSRHSRMHSFFSCQARGAERGKGGKGGCEAPLPHTQRVPVVGRNKGGASVECGGPGTFFCQRVCRRQARYTRMSSVCFNRSALYNASLNTCT